MFYLLAHQEIHCQLCHQFCHIFHLEINLKELKYEHHNYELKKLNVQNIYQQKNNSLRLSQPTTKKTNQQKVSWLQTCLPLKSRYKVLYPQDAQ